MYSGGILCYYMSIALSLVALSSGTAVFALLRKRSSSSKPKDERSKNSRPHVDKVKFTVDDDGEKEDAWDIISQLPDEILIPVIDRLTARDAVRMSILSKRWTDIYAFARDVNFNCLRMFGLNYGPSHWNNTGDLQKKFIDGVDMFFHRHCSYTKMRSVKLSCCFARYFPNKLNQWIRSAGRLGVEKLFLSFNCVLFSEEVNFSFQLQLLSEVPSLKHVTLHMCSLEPNLKSQCYSLKTLHLREITLVPSAVECIVSNCLSLQTLVIHQCKLYPKLRIHGPNLQLEVLLVEYTDVEEIELYASNLVTFRCLHYSMIKVSFDYVPKLQNYTANLCCDEDMPLLYNKLAKDLPQLSSLVFETNKICYQEMRSPSGVAMFSNLRRLVIELYIKIESDILSISLVLDMCPVLEEFHLVTKVMRFDGEQVKRTFALSKSQLKKVELSGFCGTDIEMSFAKCILKSVRTLEQMYINIHFLYYPGIGYWTSRHEYKWSDDRLEMMREWLQRQAISKYAQVIFRPVK